MFTGKLLPPKKQLSLLALSIAFVVNAQASEWTDLRQAQADVTGNDKITSIAELETATSSKMALIKTWNSTNGLKFSRWTQMFKGLPIYGETLITRESSGGDFRATGTALMGLTNDLDITPVVTGNAAIKNVQDIDKPFDNPSPVTPEYKEASATLVIYQGAQPNDVATIAWAVTYFADRPNGGDPRRIFALMDAKIPGKVLQAPVNAVDRVKPLTGPGGNTKTGIVNYGTDRPALTVSDNCEFVNNLSLNQGQIQTQILLANLNGSVRPATQVFSTDCNTQTPNNTFQNINGAFSPVNDAYYFGSEIVKMYSQYVNVKPLNGPLIMQMHYSTNYENAFWDGQRMTFGDGANTFFPLVSLDVTAHEVSHGFTEQNSGLVYANQSGGMNEAFSDMAGEAAEFFTNGSADFLVGVDITKPNGALRGGALRSMLNPPDDGRSIGNAQDFRQGMDVHFSSGVYNKAFAILAQSPGWTIPTAFNVFAQANMTYWTPNVTFNQGACGVLDAAVDLGQTAQNVQSIADAFAQVGVACAGRTGAGGPGGNSFQTTTAVNIPDANTAGVASPLNVTMNGDSGNVTVNVNISHSWRGDLVVSLVEPSGRSVVLDDIADNDSANDIVKSYTVNAAGIPANGQWQLRVADLSAQDTGTINSWSLTFNPGAANLVSSNTLTNTNPANTLNSIDKSAVGGSSGSGGGGGGSALPLSLFALLTGVLGLRRRKK